MTRPTAAWTVLLLFVLCLPPLTGALSDLEEGWPDLDCRDRTGEFLTVTGGDAYETSSSLCQTVDGGFVILGSTDGFGAGDTDLLLLRYDPAGSLLWARVIGGPDSDEPRSVVETADGGFALAALTLSFGAGDYDVLLVRLSLQGDLLWARTAGGTGSDTCQSMDQTADGGFILAGTTDSWGQGSNDVLLLRYDSSGVLLWSETLGGTSQDVAYSVRESEDARLAVAGYTYSFGAGNLDALLMVLDSSGGLIWARTCGGVNQDYGTKAVPIGDGSFVLIGSTESYGAGDADILLSRFTSSGGLVWTRTAGGVQDDRPGGLEETSDGGFILSGSTESYGAGDDDGLLLRYDSGGSLIWASSIGSPGVDYVGGGEETSDGGFVTVGASNGYGSGSPDLLILKVDSDGLIPGCYEVAPCSPVTASAVPTVDTPALVLAACYPSQSFPEPSVMAVTLPSEQVCPDEPTPTPTASPGPGPASMFVRTTGGTGGDYARAILETWDGGLAAAGETLDGVTSLDALLCRYDSTGELFWSRSTGGAGFERIYALDETSDAGLVLAGFTESFGAGGSDTLLLRYEEDGTLSWGAVAGGGGDDEIRALQVTSDGGAVTVGTTESYGAGGEDILLQRYDSDGSLLWSRTAGGAGDDQGQSVRIAGDGGFLVVGSTDSFGAGSNDILLLRYSSGGSLLWARTAGGDDWDTGRAVLEAPDGGCWVGGSTSEGPGWDGGLILRYDDVGALLWARSYGGTLFEYVYAMAPASDGGLILAGVSATYGGGSTAGLLLRCNPDGYLAWASTIMVDDWETFSAVVETADGGFAMVGDTNLGAGQNDWMLAKTGPDGLIPGCVGAAPCVPDEASPALTITSPVILSSAPTLTVEPWTEIAFDPNLLTSTICSWQATPTPTPTAIPPVPAAGPTGLGLLLAAVSLGLVRRRR